MRPIDADELKIDLQLMKDDLSFNNPYKTAEKCEEERAYIENFIDLVNDSLTIEVEPVRHGEWIESESSYSATEVVYNCSLCRNEFIVQRCDKIDFNYCPNCGAKMN